MTAKLRNFIPQDTRIFEIFQGLCQLFIGILFLMQIDQQNLQNYVAVWGIICVIITMIQFIAILFHPAQMFARIATMWGAGSIWMYLGFNCATTILEATLTLMIGLSCFIQFIINTIIISEYHRKEGPDAWIS